MWADRHFEANRRFRRFCETPQLFRVPIGNRTRNLPACSTLPQPTSSPPFLFRVGLKVKKLKVACGAFQALQPVGRSYPCPPMSSPHSSTEAPCPTQALETSASEGGNKEFCQHIVIHGGTRFFYMPQSWDMGQILSLPLRRKAFGGFFRYPKNPTTSAGFEPTNSGTSGQHAYHYTTQAVQGWVINACMCSI